MENCRPTQRSTPFFARVDLQFYWGWNLPKHMGYHLGSRCFVRSWEKRKKLVQSFKKDPKRPLVCDKTLDFWRAANNYLLFLNMWICAFFFGAFTKMDALLEPPRWSINTFKEENSMGLFLDGPIFWDAAPYFWANCSDHSAPETVVIKGNVSKCPWFRIWNDSKLPRYVYHWDLSWRCFLFVNCFFSKEFIARNSPLWSFKRCVCCHMLFCKASTRLIYTPDI